MAIFFPGAERDLGGFDEAPVTFLTGLQVEVVADGGRDVDGCALVRFVLWWAVSEDIVPVIGDPGAAVFPLGVATTAVMVDLNPLSLEAGSAGSGICSLEPWNHASGFRFV